MVLRLCKTYAKRLRSVKMTKQYLGNGVTKFWLQSGETIELSEDDIEEIIDDDCKERLEAIEKLYDDRLEEISDIIEKMKDLFYEEN